MNPFLGEIIMFGGNFAPRGWALCDGQLLSINNYQALFSILGTTYGGDGRTTFGLPDLRGRLAMHHGTGPGLTSNTLGEKKGAYEVTITQSTMASHNHTATLHGESTVADKANPEGKLLAGASIYEVPVAGDNKTLSNESILVLNQGGSQPHNNDQPYQAVNYIIALQGVFPSRN